MAGHSKWANIQHRKCRQDAKRSQLFAKLIKEITVATRMGGADPASNPRLRLAVDKAFDSNIPKDNVQRAIDRGSGNLEGINYEEIRYEGYGIGGAALIIDCLTDNRVRTVANIRHVLSKHGGNLGTDGCVAYQFTHCGVMVFSPDTDEEMLLGKALDFGASDVISNDDGSFEVITAPYEMFDVRERLQEQGLRAAFAEVTMRANNETILNEEQTLRMQKLLEALGALDDVQELYSSASI